MIVPMRSATTYRNSRSSAGMSSDQHEQLTQLDADVERQQRRQQVRAGELQRLPQREREPEAVHEPEGERDQPAAFNASSRAAEARALCELCGSAATTMFSSAM